MAFAVLIVQNSHKVRKVRPGWLVRKGYGIVYMNDQEQDEFLNTIAPRQKAGKGKKWARGSGTICAKGIIWHDERALEIKNLRFDMADFEETGFESLLQRVWNKIREVHANILFQRRYPGESVMDSE
jgi:hypothetical protein